LISGASLVHPSIFLPPKASKLPHLPLPPNLRNNACPPPASPRHGETAHSKISIAAMERKRKLPARAARVEGVSKKRTSTPPESQNQPSPTPAPAPIVEEPLPRSISVGKPLPTLDAPQPEDLPSKEYQSVSERSVSPMSGASLRDALPMQIPRADPYETVEY
jgi:hypothetical protein